ncbi:hypothetical protein [Streptomyces sioyaensis]|uniref:hypothetical protein n=1 Tax=Streptomyces sioyaensis TaxID=67364 RepID=UPI0037BBE1D6
MTIPPVRIAVTIAAAVSAFVLLIAAATVVLGGGLFGSSTPPITTARQDIPPRMLTLYLQASATCPGLDWAVLAAIGKVETDHARMPNIISTAGAVGPMQFEPSTFTACAHPVSSGGKNPPTPGTHRRAVYAAARRLCANGACGGKHLWCGDGPAAGDRGFDPRPDAADSTPHDGLPAPNPQTPRTGTAHAGP